MLLDDNRDGAEDAGVAAGVCDDASAEIDRYLSSRMSVPMASPPDWVSAAATVLACYQLWARRDTPAEKNPFAGESQAVRNDLAAIARGERPSVILGRSDDDVSFDEEFMLV